MSRLFVRADGSRQIGLGHVMRSLAVAEVARDREVDVRYVMTADEVATELVQRRGFDAERANSPDDLGWLDLLQAGDRVLVDGYRFLTNGVPAAARERQAVVAVVDDHDGGDIEADVVVNPNAVDPAKYPNARHACCGPQYAMVRGEFVPYRRARVGGAGTLLVTFGGSDAAAVGERAINAIGERAAGVFERVVLVVGPAAPEPPTRSWLEVVRDPEDVAATFDRADAALSAAGSTTWELLCLGVPCALVEVAENQRLVATTAAARGGAIALGRTDEALPRIPDALRRLADQIAMSAGALATVDGLGAARILDTLMR